MIKIAIFYTTWRKPLGKLMRVFTGCYAYHMAFVDMDTGQLYEMNITPRMRDYGKARLIQRITYGSVTIHDMPTVIDQTRFKQYLEHTVKYDRTLYGFQDYALIMLSKVLERFGVYKTFGNHKGMICSEFINRCVKINGWVTPWRIEDQPPTPCDWARYFNAR